MPTLNLSKLESGAKEIYAVLSGKLSPDSRSGDADYFMDAMREWLIATSDSRWIKTDDGGMIENVPSCCADFCDQMQAYCEVHSA